MGSAIAASAIDQDLAGNYRADLNDIRRVFFSMHGRPRQPQGIPEDTEKVKASQKRVSDQVLHPHSPLARRRPTAWCHTTADRAIQPTHYGGIAQADS